MVKLFLAVAFVLTCQQEACSDLRFDDFKRVEEMVDETADILWNIDDVSSKLKCATLCLAESTCVTFGFDEAKGSCQAFSSGLRTEVGKHSFTAYCSKRRRSANMRLACKDDKDCYNNGSVCFRGRCICDPEFTYNTSKQACLRKPSGMYQPCVNKGHCLINGSVCFMGQCLCSPGLSYHKSEQVCVRKCSTYGKTMSLYKGLSITDHNTRKIDFVYQDKKCVRYCTASRRFLCLSLDMNPSKGYCRLSNYGYLDVNESDREHGEDGWLLATRDCAYD